MISVCPYVMFLPDLSQATNTSGHLREMLGHDELLLLLVACTVEYLEINARNL